jgi:hypothetical protein
MLFDTTRLVLSACAERGIDKDSALAVRKRNV